MAFATIAGIEVPFAALREGKPIVVGERERAFDGSLLSTERDDKRTWSGTTSEITEAEFQALRTATRLGTQVSFVGDATNGESLTVVVDLTDGDYAPDGSGVRRNVSVAIEEA